MAEVPSLNNCKVLQLACHEVVARPEVAYPRNVAIVALDHVLDFARNARVHALGFARNAHVPSHIREDRVVLARNAPPADRHRVVRRDNSKFVA